MLENFEKSIFEGDTNLSIMTLSKNCKKVRKKSFRRNVAGSKVVSGCLPFGGMDDGRQLFQFPRNSIMASLYFVTKVKAMIRKLQT